MESPLLITIVIILLMLMSASSFFGKNLPSFVWWISLISAILLGFLIGAIVAPFPDSIAIGLSNYSLMHYTSDDAKKGAAAFLIAVTDITVGIPAFGLILSGQPHLMKAGEALETLVVLPVNVLGIKMWRDAEHGKLEEVVNVSAIPDQNIPYTPYHNQEPN